MNVSTNNAYKILSTSTIIKNLGKGTYGQVNLIRYKNNKRYAVKIQKTEFEDLEDYMIIESGILSFLEGVPNFIQLKGISLTTKHIRFVMESMDYNLCVFIDNIEIDERIIYTKSLYNSLLKGISVLEKHGLHHFDLKPANILIKIQDGKPIFKICDFGISGISYGPYSFPVHKIVSKPYRSPELLVERKRTEFPLYACDIWCVSMIVSEFIIGKTIFDHDDDDDIIDDMVSSLENVTRESFLNLNKYGSMKGFFPIETIIRKKVPNKILKYVPNQILKNLNKICTFDPLYRPTATYLLEKDDPDYVCPTLSLTVPHRSLTEFGIELIIDLYKIYRFDMASTIMAIEIYTRTLGIEESIYKDANIPLACFLIAIKFGNTQLLTASKLSRYIKHIHPTENLCTEKSISRAERLVLSIIQFNIYNPDIRNVIIYAYNNNISLEKILYIEYIEPVINWFKNAQIRRGSF